jgi:short-subunit dehydrogenase
MAKNQTVLITGASSGIGENLTQYFGKDGYNMVLVARQAEKLDQLAKELKQTYGIEAWACPYDLNDPEAPKALFSELSERQITVQILVNNAGFGEYGLFEEISLEKQLSMMQVNMVAVVHLSKLFLNQLPKGSTGKIMNVASTAAFQPGPLMAVYYATKAFVLSFSEALANELAARKVTVTALCPGPTRTEFETRAGLSGSAVFAGNIASPEEVAEEAYEGLMAGKTVVIPGFKNQLMAFSTRFAPRELVTRIVRYMQEKR